MGRDGDLPDEVAGLAGRASELPERDERLLKLLTMLLTDPPPPVRGVRAELLGPRRPAPTPA